jgi:acyl carrier protein
VEDAGGDSLKALQLLLHLEDRLGQRLSTDVLAADMTPSGLCAAIERGLGELPKHRFFVS